ncbi:bifunctional diaminohydroxyphosphoribosylaminopyrimidine deaminase/5-amino-6-(5-phosphoribosylamino)uracil reductase RibD [uncultured Gimesia sp.]|uniref:bifunctional diaminohydroxyphosphoribosylaminopyrimidine deaminase/5-amino-6-(5-phosphoribosylamino)uracil reductase RibD n=1 Tax=uncultured Gimesia sp. TaxID=1678688 RepID=UPI002630A86A|nr:bifunctional diaminohydroxyphosphoribosylaminopyrimidine deaminase/5-amino-6-(5-phosphoribosylamino)uracil reductase RibD [uncultured Gimesia sp.]
MQRALELAKLGRGYVEPNPAVGSVIVDENLRLIGEGYHQQYGGPHAEIHALNMAGSNAKHATIYVTLEPCCHHGKTGPCSQALIQAGIKKAVIAMRDPAPHVAGGGITELQKAGVEVEVGLLESAAQKLVRPFIKRVTKELPWVHAKWAMTLDGKIATGGGHSQWISNERSREIVHRLRGCMDAIMIGHQTAKKDNPLLTVRPAGARTPARIIVDSQATLSCQSNLVQSISDAPVIVIAHESAPPENIRPLEKAGVEVLLIQSSSRTNSRQLDLHQCLLELGRKEMTNILIEGGGSLLGSCFDEKLIDEVHVFIAPKLVGGKAAITPIAGEGLEKIPHIQNISDYQVQILDSDIYVQGLIDYQMSF